MKESNTKDIFLEFDRAQKLSGLVTGASLLITIIGVYLIPAEEVLRTQILIVIALVAMFSGIYYNSPKLYLNPKFRFLPDIAFLTAGAFSVLSSGHYGPFFLIFLFLIITIDAYIFSLKEYVVVVIASLILINVGSIFIWKTNPGLAFIILIQSFSLIGLAIVSRLFAGYSLKVREQKEALEKLNKQILRDKRESLDLLDSIGDGILSINGDGKIYLHNKSSVDLLGIKNLEGKNLNEVFNLYSRDKLPVDILKGITDSSPLIRTDLYYKKGRQWLRFYVHLNPLFADGALIGLIILFRDITKEKQMDEQNTEFVAVASHEMRTPLAQIEGFLFLAMKQLEEVRDISPETKNNIEMAHNSAINLINLTNDILTVFKLDSNKMEVVLKQVKLSDIIGGVISNYEKDVAKKNLKIHYKNQCKNESKIITDESKLTQILSNLVQNAIKFTERGSVEIVLKEDNKSFIIKVSDTGYGIDHSALKHVFERFYRPENWETRKTQGTGLGLYIVKNLVERLSGEIAVESARDIGSTFTLTLPKEYKNSDDLKKASEEELKNFIGTF